MATIGVTLLVNHALVVRWGMAILTALIGLLLSVTMGLAMGVFFQRKQQLNSWGMGIFTVILGPMFLNVIEPILPKALQAVFNWVPTVTLVKAFRFSFSRGATPLQIASNLGITAASAVLVLALVVWRVRQMDR